jgi:hypothetical protein
MFSTLSLPHRRHYRDGLIAMPDIAALSSPRGFFPRGTGSVWMGRSKRSGEEKRWPLMRPGEEKVAVGARLQAGRAGYKETSLSMFES